MQAQNRNIVVLYDPDIDGGLAASFFARKYGSNPAIQLKFVPLPHGRPDIHHDTIIKHLSPGSEIYFVDTAPTRREMQEIVFKNLGFEHGKCIRSGTVWDHHDTEVDLNEFSIPWIDSGIEVPDFIVDINPAMDSATQLVWPKLFPGEEPPPILEYIGKIESGKLETYDERIIAAYVDSFNFYDEKSIPGLSILCELPLDEIKRRGESLYAKHCENTETLRDKFKFTALDLGPANHNCVVPIVEIELPLPEYGRPIEDLLKEKALTSPSKIACAAIPQNDGSVKLSVRSFGSIRAPDAVTYLKEIFKQSGGGRKNMGAVQFVDRKAFDSCVHIFPEEDREALVEALVRTHS